MAIVAEVLATSALPSTGGFRRLRPGVAVLAGYGLSPWALTQTPGTIPVGVVYITWAGVGVATIGRLWRGQRMDAPAMAGKGRSWRGSP